MSAYTSQSRTASLCLCTVVAFLFARPPAARAQDSRFRWPEGKRVAVSLSFDDGRASQVDVGTPLFDRYGAKATFYVNPRSLPRRLDVWKKAAAAGHEIANHSTNHPCTGNFPWSRKNALENYTEAMMENEMTGASAEIERLINVKSTTFAYPCGEKFLGRGVDTRSYVPLVAKHFRAGRGFRDESASDPLFCDLAQLQGVDSDGLTFDEMKQLVLAAEKQGAWLVFAGHDIGKPGRQTTEAAVLEQFLKYAMDPASGVWLATIDTIAKYIQEHRPAL